MQYENYVVLCTGTCRVPAKDVLKALADTLVQPRNYTWSLDVNEETGIAKLLCFEAKRDKKIPVDGVQVQVKEPLNPDSVISRFVVDLVITRVLIPQPFADKIYADLVALAKEFAKSFEGYERPSTFAGLATAE